MNTIKNIEDKIQETLTLYKAQKKVSEVLINIFKVFDGKKVTKRMETAAKEAHPEYTTYYEAGYTVYLYVWGNGIDYSNRMMVKLCYKDDATFSYDKFVEDIKGYNSGERIGTLEHKLQELPQLFSQYKEICDKVNKFNKSVDVWPLSMLFKI